MSWLYSQALVEEYLGDISLDGEQSVPLNGNPTQQAYLSQDKMTKFSQVSRFGMTFKPLTDTLGEELLMLYREGFHAKTSVPQEKAQELMENEAECGEKWRGSFTKYDPDSSSWKTHQCSLLGDLEEFLETWPQWGLMRDGECWEQRTLEQTIRGTGFGLLPNGVDSFHTPNTIGLDGGSNSRKALKKRLMFPTPVKSEGNGSAAFKLTDAVEASMGRTMPKMQKNPHKWQEFQTWPTPNAWDAKRGPMSKELMETGKHQISLVTAVRHNQQMEKIPTSQASDHRDRGNMSNPSIQRRAEKGKQLNLSMVAHPTSGQLNPTWVEWLMGWPLGWTDLKPLETDKSLYVLQPHGVS